MKFRPLEFILAVCLLITAFTAYVAVSEAMRWEPCQTNLYPETGIVVAIENDEVVFRNSLGHLFSFYGAEDYEVGDMVSLIMDDYGTPLIFDDVVFDHRYSGNVNGLLYEVSDYA